LRLRLWLFDWVICLGWEMLLLFMAGEFELDMM
jgi:hypothetical protein